MTTPTLSDREVDAAIASEVMGWRVNTEEVSAADRNSIIRPHPPGTAVAHPGLPTTWVVMPAFTDDLAACAEAESRILQYGNIDAYTKALLAELDLSDWTNAKHAQSTIHFQLATAPASARARAMVKAVRSQR